jgi:hypothetical protein
MALEPKGVTARRKLRAPYPTNDAVEVSIADSDYQRVPGTLTGVSRSGLLIELGIMIAKGTTIVIFLTNQVVIIGEVRHCRRAANAFRGEVLVKDVVYDRPWLVKHVHEDQLALYLAGRGLTALEVIQLRTHLLDCAKCRNLFAETPAILHTAWIAHSCAS